MAASCVLDGVCVGAAFGGVAWTALPDRCSVEFGSVLGWLMLEGVEDGDNVG